MSAENRAILIKLEGRRFEDAGRIEHGRGTLDIVCTDQVRLKLPAQRRMHREYFGM